MSYVTGLGVQGVPRYGGFRGVSPTSGKPEKVCIPGNKRSPTWDLSKNLVNFDCGTLAPTKPLVFLVVLGWSWGLFGLGIQIWQFQTPGISGTPWKGLVGHPVGHPTVLEEIFSTVVEMSLDPLDPNK